MSEARRERKGIKPETGRGSGLVSGRGARPDGSDILTHRLRLRPLRPSDEATLARLSASDAARQNLTIALLVTAERNRRTFIVERRSDRAAIGAGGFRPMAGRDAAVEFAVCLDEAAWGSGFGTEAAQALIDVAFGDATVVEVWAAIRVTNNRARRVYEKCGFQPRGTGMARASSGAFPVEHVVLGRRAWTSLKAWGAPDARKRTAMALDRPRPDGGYYGGARAGDFAGRVTAPAFRPTIVTDRLVLRPPRPFDADDVVASIGDLAVSRNLARVPHPYSRENAEDFIGFAVRTAIARRAVISAITLRGRLIGVVSVDGVPRRNRLGYWLAREQWGRGYATEAVNALVAYVFAVFPAHVIRAGVFVDNPASLHVLTKLGFRPVRRLVSRPLARDAFVEHIATVLPRSRYLELNR